ncbi:MAG TPA: alpha-amylase [Micromonosporaceae bacterium]|nr:alpha-amylase [Micromonosporaceae bacterium]
MSRTRPLLAGAASLLLTAAIVAVINRSPVPASAKADANPGARDVIVHLFEWPWASIASECINVLGPKGFGAVQVSPPQEHVVLPGLSYPWWQDYQPVSYQVVSRRGNRAAFASMVQTCHTAGVKIYVDAVVNHMAGGGSTGPGSNGSTYSQYSYPSVPYGTNDFHHCGRNGNDDIQNWTDRWEVQNCELVDLSDLKTESAYVRGKLTAYLNDLISLGVDGFRIDAAKHTPVADLQAVVSGLNGNPYIFSEVIEGGPGEISPAEYVGIGDVTEFRYGDKVGNAFRDANLSGLNDFGGMLLGSGDAVNFIDNHDTQRNGRARLTYKDGQTHALAQAFSLAYPYGTPQLMSSFTFSNNEAGPPSAGNGTTNPVTCGSGWECEHRKPIVANLVAFHNQVNGTNVNSWTSPQSNRIAFGRGNVGFAAFNRSGSAWTQTFATQLPNGSYCNVALTGCSAITVSGGQFTATVPANGMIAIQSGTTGTPSPTPTGCTSTAVTFNLNESAFVVGSIPALGSWNTANAIPVPGTVNIPFNTSFQYKYIKKDAAGNVTWEYDPNRSHTTGTACSVTHTESWNGPGGGTCTSIAVTFEVNATTVFGQNVYVTGSVPTLSSWNTGSAIALSSAAYPVWRGTVNIAPSTSFEYKFIKKDGGGNVIWESGANRTYTTAATPCTATISTTWK